MAYDIYLSDCLFALMDELPRRTCATIHLMLARIAELAENWPAGDERWHRFAYCDDQGLRFYTGGCCVRISLESDTRRLVVREIGRVLARLPAEVQTSDSSAMGSPAH
jgi:hypothetical protein